MEKWILYNKRADFAEIGKRFSIDPVLARIIRNREVKEMEDIRKFLSGTVKDLYDPHLLKDGDLLAEILADKIRQGRSIRIIGDYDIDGVMSTYILICALRRCGGRVSWQIPDRIIDGYGLNRNLILQAREDGIDTILTCDNGISALQEIELAKSLGMTVLVTDHHEIPFDMIDGERVEKVSKADAVVNAHQKLCPYPNKDMCGAVCAWKVVCLLYEKMEIPMAEALEFLENAAFATVGDIMSLTGENRIIVREGLRRIHHTKNPGMRALIAQCGLDMEEVGTYHFGFVLGPCINASGRLDTAERALEMFLSPDPRTAARIASELVVLNEERKQMTLEGTEKAKQICEAEGYDRDRVLVIYLPEVHESVAGIIAGRIKEYYYKPTFILTRGKDGLKGSGRSIEAYSMYEEMCKCSHLLGKFGGHPMAAGLSLPEENLEAFRRLINQEAALTEEDMTPRVYIDVPMPMSYATMDLVRQFSLLEPFGRDNARPLFAEKGIRISRMWVIGRNRNVLRLSLLAGDGTPVSAIYFGDLEAFMSFIREKYGQAELNRALEGRENHILMNFVYCPSINSYRGSESLQFEIKYYC